MQATQDEGVCNQCHNGGGHHLKGTDLENAKHSDASSAAFTEPVGPGRQVGGGVGEGELQAQGGVLERADHGGIRLLVRQVLLAAGRARNRTDILSPVIVGRDRRLVNHPLGDKGRFLGGFWGKHRIKHC